MSINIENNIVCQLDGKSFTIDSKYISFSGYKEMYITGDGYGLQINNEQNRNKIKDLCFKIWNLLDELNKEIKINESD